MKEILYNEGQLIKERLAEISDYIYRNPELGNEEYKAVEALTTFLKEHGFEIECPYSGMNTAFKATFDSGKEGMTVGYLCEYDALPKIGHGCGHNMIGVMSAGAGVVLSKVLSEIGGKIIVYGTPAEETNGGKVILTEAGAFDELDAAMIVHPDGETRASGSSSALYPIRFIYKGKTAHAASCPEKGINALNSVIQLFNGIDALRQHVTPDVRMHGIITKGGVAANIVPDEAIADFYFRASTKERVTEVVEKVKRIAEGAALMTGATLEMERYELPYDDLKTNETLSEIFNSNLRELGITDIKEAKVTGGSSDIGNVSHVAPTIHPYIGVTDCPMVGHSVEMANSTITSKAHDRLLIAALAMAYTGHDIIVRNESLR
ncbi:MULTISPECIES: M20 family metallopeptidase [unclassified Clostridium]|uniref:M20 family metallopeptidase n=1 Tax=Clostridium TaxID=1485 RepID=UPI001C8BB83F|nr:MULTISPECIES: M20 family metallopeptidase [unclassified Clostridium]MBX9136306.1 M20 family metallopeptidase [Clostridium sp. K12(2020)]MBX9143422.1 M20 family metallopeptidase [Clostridium sp. K13]MDU4323812.1 M20 family metallopeptidase [Clostridium celatum]